MNIVQQNLVEIVAVTACLGASIGTASAFKEEIKVGTKKLYMQCKTSLSHQISWLQNSLPNPRTPSNLVINPNHHPLNKLIKDTVLNLSQISIPQHQQQQQAQASSSHTQETEKVLHSSNHPSPQQQT